MPTLAVLFIALATQPTFEALFCGALLGYVTLQPATFFSGFVDSPLKVMPDPVMGWVILVCGLFGWLIHLLVASGGVMAFASLMLRDAKTRRTALLVTWLLGLVLFIDDYRNSLTIGSSLKPVTDRFRVSRELLASLVDSTAAPVCMLVPLSTWSIYVAGLLESNGLARTGEGLQAYVQTMPLVIYGWVAALIVPPVAWGIIPQLGAMKRAEACAAKGPLSPPDSAAIALDTPQLESIQTPRLGSFALPIVVLIGATVNLGYIPGPEAVGST